MIGKAMKTGALVALAAVVVIRIVTRQNRGEPRLYTPQPEPELAPYELES